MITSIHTNTMMRKYSVILLAVTCFIGISCINHLPDDKPEEEKPPVEQPKVDEEKGDDNNPTPPTPPKPSTPSNPSNPSSPSAPRFPVVPNFSAEEDKLMLVPEHNLLSDGNCEQWYELSYPYQMLSAWSWHSNQNLRKESKIVAEGKYSARLSAVASGMTAVLDQRVEVVPERYIRIRMRYYIGKWKAKGARMYGYFRRSRSENLSADELKEAFDDQTLQIIRGGGYGLPYLPDKLGEWQTFDYIIKVPKEACYFVFDVRSYFGTTIYIDDCFVIDLDKYFQTSTASAQTVKRGGRNVVVR